LKKNLTYIKHIYWLTKEEEANLREELATSNIKLKSAKGIVCTPLDAINKITSVAPDIWNDTCNRQGSWYRTSEKNGMYLVVSSFELTNYGDHKAAVITESDFIPPRLASLEDKNILVQDELIKRRIPEEWLHPRESEKKIYLRWARRLGSDVQDYNFLYLSHTANHANFIDPHFFISIGEEIVPYSIDRSAHLCSCCVELFQVLGSQYKKKMVVPCPGATIFARLKPDRYLLVENA
jgi:hypothetical protein